MSDIHQESPLVARNTPERQARNPAQAGVSLVEHAFCAVTNLRGVADKSFLTAVKKSTGVQLPTEPNTVAQKSGVRALWLGPEEWYLVGAPGTEMERVAALEEALAGKHFAVTDQTSGVTTISLSGPHARDVLEKGCTLDLHPNSFQPGQCAQTLIAHAGVVMIPGISEYELIVRRSLADYLWVWIEDAALEFGLVVQAA